MNVQSAHEVVALSQGVLAGDRASVARAVTLVESTRSDHQVLAQHLLALLLPHAGQALRVGITGVPGVGKSTLIDALGMQLLALGHRVAVLAVDPSSTRTGGSILGDRTRMMRLAQSERAFIRPSPTSGTLGGVARATREAMVVMEAAGFDVVIVETVGVGQSEITVAGMVDCFLFLTLARTGDQLQGIKKGVLELADVIAVNKAEEPHTATALAAARELQSALHLVTPTDAPWQPPVQTCSAQEGTGLAELWATVLEHQVVMRSSGLRQARRESQRQKWMWAMVHDGLLVRLHAAPSIAAMLPDLERGVADGTVPVGEAAARILAAFSSAPK